jgi:hypothetical protein
MEWFVVSSVVSFKLPGNRILRYETRKPEQRGLNRCPLLDNDSVNTLPQQWIRKQQSSNFRCYKHAFQTIERLYFLRGACEVVIKESSEVGRSSIEWTVEFETPACQDMWLGAEKLDWVGSCRIMVRKELVREKKAWYVIWSDGATVINPLPG